MKSSARASIHAREVLVEAGKLASRPPSKVASVQEGDGPGEGDGLDTTGQVATAELDELPPST